MSVVRICGKCAQPLMLIKQGAWTHVFPIDEKYCVRGDPLYYQWFWGDVMDYDMREMHGYSSRP